MKASSAVSLLTPFYKVQISKILLNPLYKSIGWFNNAIKK